MSMRAVSTLRECRNEREPNIFAPENSDGSHTYETGFVPATPSSCSSDPNPGVRSVDLFFFLHVDIFEQFATLVNADLVVDVANVRIDRVW